jgi:hypothetical protein
MRRRNNIVNDICDKHWSRLWVNCASSTDQLHERWRAVETLANLILQRRGLTYKEAVAVLQDVDMRVPQHE